LHRESPPIDGIVVLDRQTTGSKTGRGINIGKGISMKVYGDKMTAVSRKRAEHLSYDLNLS